MNIIDEQSEAMDKLQDAQTDLWGLAAGFEIVGNHIISNKLRELALDLETTQKVCEDIFYRHNENAYKHAVLAGINVSKEHD